jgi:hypothetical protein
VEENYVILAAVSELCAARTQAPEMREVMLRLSKSYRQLSEQHASSGGQAFDRDPRADIADARTSIIREGE